MDQKEKKEAIEKLFFIRATMSQISQYADPMRNIEKRRKTIEEEIKENERKKKWIHSFWKVSGKEQERAEKQLESYKKDMRDPVSQAKEHVGHAITTLIFFVPALIYCICMLSDSLLGDLSVLGIILLSPIVLIVLLSLLFELPTVFASEEKIRKIKAKAEKKYNELTLKTIDDRNEERESLDLALCELRNEDASLQKELQEKQEVAVANANALYESCKEKMLPFLDERDWKYADVIIYMLETGRAESLKEALQQCDLFVRHAQIISSIEKAATAVCEMIQDGFASLSRSITVQFNSLNAQMERLNQTQLQAVEKLDKLVSAEQLNNALLAKAETSSQQLEKDVRYLRDQEFYRS